MNKISHLLIVLWLLLSCPILSLAKPLPQVSSKETSCHIHYLLPTSETKDFYDVYEEGGDYPFFTALLDNTFIKQDLCLYNQVLKYAPELSPTLNVIFKPQSGCYGKIGFYLKHKDGSYEFMNESYIELDAGYENDPAGLIPIFSHELAHIFSSALISDNEETSITSTQMHAASTLTDYNIAFSEGFSEHFEVIARDYETNPALLTDYVSSLSQLSSKSRFMENISRDFSLPIRLGYYRNLSPFLMSRFDDYKRYYLVTNQKACYENTVKNFSNPEVTMLYRNMGLSYTSTLRPLARNLSTESVIASFFRELITLESGSLSEKYDRIFSVMAHSINDSNASLLQQFVAGYLEAYPEYASNTLKAYKNSTGYDYSEAIIPEIWIANLCGGPIMTYDQYNTSPSPAIIFNLNTCYLEDLIAMSIPESEAKAIIDYRCDKGYFGAIEDLQSIQHVSHATYDLLYNAHSEETLKKASEQYNDFAFTLMKQLNPGTILQTNMLHLFYKLNLVFLVFILIYSLLLYYLKWLPTKKVLLLIKQYFKWCGFTLIGLSVCFLGSVLVLSNAMLPILPTYILIILLCELLFFLILHKRPLDYKRHLLSSSIMFLLILYSLI